MSHWPIDFAHALWSDILASWTPDKILTLGNDTFSSLRSILVTRLGARLMDQPQEFPTGWGSTKAIACRFRLPRRDAAVTLARLPNLSRFKLMSEETYRQPVQTFLDYVYAPPA